MSNLSATSVAGLILTLLGFIVGIVAMATDHWADVARYQNGIYSGPKIEVLKVIQAIIDAELSQEEAPILWFGNILTQKHEI